MRVGGGGGEIVQVQGGHIIRATGRKDRHSKVYTAKGPRDRRVRLSAHTAIQFYDVQDRLGYDRPSKAVDWLIKKAKDAIDKLDHLPPFDPNNNRNPHGLDPNNNLDVGPTPAAAAAADLAMAAGGGGGGEGNHTESSGYEIQQIHGHPHHQIGGAGGGDNNMAAALSLDSQSMVAETMRSFFPTTTAEAEQMNSMGGFQSYPHTHPQHHQDLGLSLQSFHDSERNPATVHSPFPAGFVAAGPGGAGGSGCGWAGENQPPTEMGRLSRLLTWTWSGGFGSTPAVQGVVGDAGNSPAALLLGERGTLQSCLNHHQQQPSIRAWDGLPPMGPTERHLQSQPSISGMIGVSDGFMAGFCIPPQVNHGIVAHNSNKDSSMSTDSSH